MSNLPSLEPVGWRCPGCDRCYAPGVLLCWFCGNQVRDFTNTGGSGAPFTVRMVAPKEQRTCGRKGPAGETCELPHGHDYHMPRASPSDVVAHAFIADAPTPLCCPGCGCNPCVGGSRRCGESTREGLAQVKRA